jgi:hypothetical protein
MRHVTPYQSRTNKLSGSPTSRKPAHISEGDTGIAFCFGLNIHDHAYSGDPLCWQCASGML